MWRAVCRSCEWSVEGGDLDDLRDRAATHDRTSILSRELPAPREGFVSGLSDRKPGE